jgi:hypothetical protein
MADPSLESKIYGLDAHLQLFDIFAKILEISIDFPTQCFHIFKFPNRKRLFDGIFLNCDLETCFFNGRLQKVNKVRGNFPENFEWSKQPF